MLDRVKARDVMRTDVVALQSLSPVEEAVAILEEYHIRGAPVVNPAGELVGVLTTSDILNKARMEGGTIESRARDYSMTDPSLREEQGETFWDEEPSFSKEDYSPELLGRVTVGDWMHPEIVCVGPEEPLKSVCQTLKRHSIHRVFVVEGQKLRGVISSFDVVRYVADA